MNNSIFLAHPYSYYRYNHAPKLQYIKYITYIYIKTLDQDDDICWRSTGGKKAGDKSCCGSYNMYSPLDLVIHVCIFIYPCLYSRTAWMNVYVGLLYSIDTDRTYFIPFQFYIPEEAN